MAKTKKTAMTPLQQAYKREMDRINRRIKALEKKGYIFNDYDFPPPLKRATQKSVAELKRIDAATIYAKAKWVDFETGEFISGTAKRAQERREAALKGIQRKAADKAAEQAFWTGDQPITESEKPKKAEKKPLKPKTELPPMPPDGGVIALRNFMERINTIFGEMEGAENLGKRQEKLMKAKLDAKQMILDELNKKVTELGESAVGWLLSEHAEEVEDATTAVAFASKEDTISVAIFKLLKILKDKITRNDLENMNAVSEDYESWEDY